MVNLNKIGRSMGRKIDLRVAERLRTYPAFDLDILKGRLIRHRLSQVSGTCDSSILDRLIQLGFNAENLEAIRYAPVAEVAWANGRVTQFEHVFALNAALSSEMPNTPSAFELFRSWLEKRPEKSLWSLWEDYTTDRLTRCEQPREKEFGQRLFDIASRVALASGGLLDQGDICATEQQVLNRIARVYGLSTVE